MNIYEGKAIVGNLPDVTEELVGKTVEEVLLFTPNDKPLVKNINIINSEEEGQEFYDNLPSGTMIRGEFQPPEPGEEEYWEVSASNTKTQRQLQQIQLPEISIEDIAFIPGTMTVGDMPVFVGYPEEKEFFNKIEYTYEEGEAE